MEGGVSGTMLDKYTTYQDRAMVNSKIVKRMLTLVKIIQQKTEANTEREFQ